MGPDEHDLAVAEISHVPQIVASLMAGNLTEVVPEHLRLAGQGVRDVIRIAGSDPSMWTQIITANHSAISNELARLSASLERVRTQLDSTEAVTQFMKLGVEGARSLPGKHGRRVADYVQITVEIPDSPGALARLFADVETAGVNVEDLVIEHDHAREVGYISISVEPNETESLAQVMTDAGWALKP
jgi:prephenate dehydrogenase